MAGQGRRSLTIIKHLPPTTLSVIFVLAFIIAVALLGYFLSIATYHKLHGDDNEDELGLCLRGYHSHCQTWQDKLLERATEWNIQKAINESLPMINRFK